MVINRTCRATTERGEPCRAAPLQDGDFCFWHDPEHEKEAAEARRLGGARRRRENALAAAYDLGELDSVPEIRRLVQVAVADTLNLENSVARNRALAYFAQVSTALLEKGELSERLASIEAALGPRLVKPETRSKRWWHP